MCVWISNSALLYCCNSLHNHNNYCIHMRFFFWSFFEGQMAINPISQSHSKMWKLNDFLKDFIKRILEESSKPKNFFLEEKKCDFHRMGGLWSVFLKKKESVFETLLWKSDFGKTIEITDCYRAKIHLTFPKEFQIHALPCQKKSGYTSTVCIFEI